MPRIHKEEFLSTLTWIFLIHWLLYLSLQKARHFIRQDIQQLALTASSLNSQKRLQTKLKKGTV
ncbi:hypothetical protein BVRB_6g141680 [Beta vulgaris subsp. vulgaris]|nr:hypothetical protein BVRB_6g141680 [Beta vulgaris subsp. vulgaris]